MNAFFARNAGRMFVTFISALLFVAALDASIDSRGEKMITEGLHEATVVFGVSKGLNAAVSLAQGTEVGPPGVTFTIGEVLDPINDLVERFSWVMLASIASLGVQKILLLIVTGPFFQALFILTLAAGNILLYFRFKNDRRVRRVVFKSAAVLVFLRFSIPLMALLNA
ncbi:MAG: hypothetical protein ACQERK_06700, partial [Campylobacterota bacterium]